MKRAASLAVNAINKYKVNGQTKSIASLALPSYSYNNSNNYNNNNSSSNNNNSSKYNNMLYRLAFLLLAGYQLNSEMSRTYCDSESKLY